MSARKLPRIIIALAALFLLVWSCLNYITAGTFIGVFVFGSIIALCLFWRQASGLIKRLWRKPYGKPILLFFGIIIAALATLFAYLSVNMIISVEIPTENPKAVLILGCQVRGETPSPMLEGRINAALEVYKENPDIILVASGGKGNGENLSEAECMRRYLVERGVPEEKIFTEDNSVSTGENLRFSAKILRKKGITDGIIIVTSEFHQYRARLYAKRCGLTTGARSAKTPNMNILNYWLRETAVAAGALLFGL